MKRHWISCSGFTVEVETEVVDGQEILSRFLPPIVRRFRNQPLANLLYWAKTRFTGLRHEVL